MVLICCSICRRGSILYCKFELLAPSPPSRVLTSAPSTGCRPVRLQTFRYALALTLIYCRTATTGKQTT